MSYRNHNQINQVIIQGYLTAKPEVKLDKNDNHYSIFNIGIQRYDKRNNDTYSNFFQVRAFGNSAFRMNAFQKGDLISIDGFLDKSTYKSEEGKDIVSIFVTAERIYLSHKKQSEVNQIEDEYPLFIENEYPHY